MKILCVHRYFWPDVTPQASILRAIADRWAEDGHDVTVFTSQPSYGGDDGPGDQPAREELGGISVRRMRLPAEAKHQMVRRSLNSGLFIGRAAAHAARHRYDLVVGLTTPPILPALALGAAARLRGGGFLYHCLDIYPEIAVANGDLRAGRRFRLLRAIDTRSAKRADAVVVSSQDMRACQLGRGVDRERLHVVQNLDIEGFTGTPELPAPLEPPDGVSIVLFAGNLGRFQGLDTVIDAAHLLAHRPDIRFEFLGRGAAEQDMRQRAGSLVGRTVFFRGRHPVPVARAMTDRATAALVSLNADVGRYAYPSKAITYLRAGRPIVAMTDADTELAQSVTDHGIGRVVTPGDAVGLATAITEVVDGDTAAMGRAAARFYADHYERETLLDKWSDVVRSLAAARPGTPRPHS